MGKKWRNVQYFMLSMEAIQIVLVKKGGVAPVETNTYKTQLGLQTHVKLMDGRALL